jgi:hypothetical protein
LRQFARQCGYEIVHEYVDYRVSGTKVRSSAIDQLLKDTHRRKVDAAWYGPAMLRPKYKAFP